MWSVNGQLRLFDSHKLPKPNLRVAQKEAIRWKIVISKRKRKISRTLISHQGQLMCLILLRILNYYRIRTARACWTSEWCATTTIVISFTRMNRPKMIRMERKRRKLQPPISRGIWLRRIRRITSSINLQLTWSLTKTNNSSLTATESITMRILARRSSKTWTSTSETRTGGSTTRILRSKTRGQMKTH